MTLTFRHRIDLFTRVEAPDGAGGRAVTHVFAATIMAGVERLTSTLDVAGGRARRLRRIAATVRRRPGLDPGLRLVFDGVSYDVVSVETEDVEGRRRLLIAEEARP
jgi:head-tail adaptor